MKMTLLLLCLVPFLTLFTKAYAVDYASDASVQLFQEYLRINTTTDGDLSKLFSRYQTIPYQV